MTDTTPDSDGTGRSTDETAHRLPRRKLLYGLGGAIGGGALTHVLSRETGITLAADDPPASLTDRRYQVDDNSAQAACCWQEVTKVTPDSPTGGAQFGAALAMAGGRLLVGAPAADTSGSGSAFVFATDGGSWQQQGTLAPSGQSGDDQFGVSVDFDTDGTTALVGAPAASNDAGAAYVFEYDGTSWSQTVHLRETQQTTQGLGAGVALSGDGGRALVGSPGTDDGVVFEFTRGSNGWTRTAAFTASVERGTVDAVGNAVALDAAGETAIVGANRSDILGLGSGGAFAFHRQNGGWQQAANLTDVDGDSADQGTDVAVNAAGDQAFVGTPVPMPDTTNPAGYVSVFPQGDDGWSQQTRLQTPTGDDTENLGTAIDVDRAGEMVAVGDAGDDIGQNENQGSLSVFAWQDSEWCYLTSMAAEDGDEDDALGAAVALGDAGTTVAAGAPGATADGTESGAVYVYTSGTGNGSGGSNGQQPSASTVDDFECDSLDGYTSLAGSLDDWTIQSDTVSSGESALQYTGGSSPVEIASLSELSTYPAAGDVFRVDFRPLGDWNFRTTFNFGQQADSSFHDRYEVELDTVANALRLQYDDPAQSGDTTLGETPVSYDRDVFYTLEVDWAATSQDVVVTLFDDRPEDEATEVARIAVSPPRGAPTDGGIGFFANGKGDRWVFDDIRIVS